MANALTREEFLKVSALILASIEKPGRNFSMRYAADIYRLMQTDGFWNFDQEFAPKKKPRAGRRASTRRRVSYLDEQQ